MARKAFFDRKAVKDAVDRARQGALAKGAARVRTVADIDQNFADDPEMLAFKTRLQELLVSERREQGKERIMLRALEAQIAQLNDAS